MKKVLSMLASTALLALTGTASAQGPIALTSAQMDGVTAGAIVIFQASAMASSTGATLGNILSETTVKTNSTADPLGVLTGVPSANATGQSAGLATSALVYDPTSGSPIGYAAAQSMSSATAQLH
jgi:hypothetical protein